MSFPLRILAATLGLLLAAGPVAAETLAEKNLKEIVSRQKNIFARAEAEKDHPDEAWLRGEIQNVINSYDVLIQKSPDFAAAHVAYGLLLGRVGMNREAAAMLLKANKLDPAIPLVKNEMARLLAEDGKPVAVVTRHDLLTFLSD